MAFSHATYVSGCSWGRPGRFWPKQLIAKTLEVLRRDVNIEGLTIASEERILYGDVIVKETADHDSNSCDRPFSPSSLV